MIDYSPGFSKHILSLSELATPSHSIEPEQNFQVLYLTLARDARAELLMLILLSREDYPKYRPRKCALWGPDRHRRAAVSGGLNGLKGVNRNVGHPTLSISYHT